MSNDTRDSRRKNKLITCSRILIDINDRSDEVRREVYKVLQKVLLGLPITEMNMKKGDRIKSRRPRTKRVPSLSGFMRFGCHAQSIRERERERENISQLDNKEKKRKEKTYA